MINILTLLGAVFLTAITVYRITKVHTAKAVIKEFQSNPNTKYYFNKVLTAYNSAGFLGNKLGTKGHTVIIDEGPADSSVDYIKKVTEPKPEVQGPITEGEQHWADMKNEEFFEELDKDNNG